MENAGVRAPVDDSGQRSRAALQAARRNLGGQLPRDGDTARSAGELPGTARVGRGGRHARDLLARRTDQGVSPGARDGLACNLRLGEAALAESALSEGSGSGARAGTRLAALRGVAAAARYAIGRGEGLVRKTAGSVFACGEP